MEVGVKCLFGRTVTSTVHSEKASSNGRVMRVVYVSLTESDVRHFGKCKSAINHLHQLQTFGIFFIEIQHLLLSNPCPRPYFKQRQKLLVLQRQLPGMPKSPEKRKLAPSLRFVDDSLLNQEIFPIKLWIPICKGYPKSFHSLVFDVARSMLEDVMSWEAKMAMEITHVICSIWLRNSCYVGLLEGIWLFQMLRFWLFRACRKITARLIW